MSSSAIIFILVIAIAVVLILVAAVLTIRNKRTDARRAEAGVIRDKAAEQAPAVGRQQALADEVAARGRAARAEAEAMTAQATGLEHQAQQQHSDAVSARRDLDREYQRAERLDPETPDADRPQAAPETAAGARRQQPHPHRHAG